MKKLLLILLGIFLLVGVTAVGLNRTDTQLTIDKAKVDAIKTTGIASINVKASPITCDDKECWADVNQPNLIQTQFRIVKSYCSKNNEPEEQCYNETLKDKSKLICHTNCIEYTDYTATELISLRDAFVKSRIEEYADKIIADASKSGNVQIDDGGQITIK